MPRTNIYRATNQEIGQEIEGTAKELAAVIGCNPSTVNKRALENGSVYGWKVAKTKKMESKQQNACSDNGFTKSLLREWEEITSQFRRKSSVC